MITISRNQLLVGEERAVFIADVALAKYVENTQDGDLLNYQPCWGRCFSGAAAWVSHAPVFHPNPQIPFTRMVLAESI